LVAKLIVAATFGLAATALVAASGLMAGGLAFGFKPLSLGPFVHVAGMNTFVPGPWLLLRYVPILSATRMPARFAIVAMMAFTVLFTMALAHLRGRLSSRRQLVTGVIAATLLFELAPFPRPLFSARIPEVYDRIARDDRDVTVLELPFGFNDGNGGGPRHGGAVLPDAAREAIVGALSRLTERAEAPAQPIVPCPEAGEGHACQAEASTPAISAVLHPRCPPRIRCHQHPRTSAALRALGMETFGLVVRRGGVALCRRSSTRAPAASPAAVRRLEHLRRRPKDKFYLEHVQRRAGGRERRARRGASEGRRAPVVCSPRPPIRARRSASRPVVAPSRPRQYRLEAARASRRIRACFSDRHRPSTDRSVNHSDVQHHRGVGFERLFAAWRDLCASRVHRQNNRNPPSANERWSP
jgi:hypothetical protein